MRKNRFTITEDLEYLKKRAILLRDLEANISDNQKHACEDLLKYEYKWTFPIVKTREEAKEIYPEFPKTSEERLTWPTVIK